MNEQFKEAWGKLWEKIGGWIDAVVLMLPNAIIAILLLVVAFFVARFLRKGLRKAALKITHNQAVSNLLGTIGAGILVTLSLFVALSILNLDGTVTSLLAGAGIVGIALGLAFQEPIINMISGIIMSMRKPFNIGDLVETNDYFGTIQRIKLTYTLLREPSGQIVSIPNKMILQNPLENYSLGGERRLEVNCGISYGDDLEKVEQISLEAVKNNVDYDDSREVEFMYKEFGDSSINFTIRFWLKSTTQPTYLDAQSQTIKALKKAFDENDITIPFPIRTLDFGIKGGEKLNAVLNSGPDSKLATS